MISCPICTSPTSKIQYKENWIVIRQCLQCKFMFTEDRSGDFRIDEIKNPIFDHYRMLEELSIKRVPILIEKIYHLLNKCHEGDPPTIFEVGYGGGALARACVELGYPYTGLEPFLDDTFAFNSNNFPNVKVHPVRIEDFETNEKFNLVVMDNVLEHIPQPIEALKKVLSFLKPRGLCWVRVPNESYLLLRHYIYSLFKTRYITFPGHVNLFTAYSLQKCFQMAGASGVKINFTSASDPIITRFLLMREPGFFLKFIMLLLRTSRIDIICHFAHFLDAYYQRPVTLDI